MEREMDGTARTESNSCLSCGEVFITLADERDDTCGECHSDNQKELKKRWLIENGRCLRCEEIPSRGNHCKVCTKGFNNADLDGHEKG